MIKHKIVFIIFAVFILSFNFHSKVYAAEQENFEYPITSEDKEWASLSTHEKIEKCRIGKKRQWF